VSARRPSGHGALLLLLACAACGKSPDTTPAQQEEETFHNVCARCHGQDGTGGPPDSLGNPGPKNFTDLAFQRSMTDAQLKNAIENGNRGMPAFGAVFTPTQVDLLVAHVRRFGPDGHKRDAP
jgi:mono/diheme cytochrome c family protein